MFPPPEEKSTLEATRKQLLSDGYCRIEGVLDAEAVRQTNAVVEELIAAQPREHFEAQKSSGSMINVLDDERFADLIAHPGALEALARLGFERPRWNSGFIISKPPRSPALFWHQDWWGWGSRSTPT